MASLPVPYTPDEQSSGSEAMPDSELLSILGAHEASAIGYQGADNDITAAQDKALSYYNGFMDDLPAQEGSSSVVDGTVALVVDNALSAVLKPFVSSDETVRFSPRGPEDVEMADQATEFVNYVFNCDNPGFLILHDWFKDAFLAKVGVIKIWWEDAPRFETHEVQIESDLQAQMIRLLPDYLGEEGGIALIGQEVPDGRVRVENVPPEEFRISNAARSDTRVDYIAHVPGDFTRSQALEMGFDAEIVDGLPALSGSGDDSTLRQTRYADESYGDDNIAAVHRANDRLELRDEYVRVDYNGDGIAELRRIIRVADVILLNEEVEDHPFALLCPIPMPHKVYGHSLADRAVQEQKIGTALWRQALDNLYKSNNPRPVIGEGAHRPDGSTEDTLNDTAPGAAVLVKDLNQFRFDAVPFTADKTFPMLELLNQKVEENTGISRAGQGLDSNAIKSAGQTTATEMAMIANGKNARTEMVARIFAETGVTRLFKTILKLVSKHQPKERMIRLRNTWVEIDPRGWPEMDVAISVGLGVGDKAEQIAQADAVIQTQALLVQSPFATMVSAENVYNAAKRKFTAAGIKNTDDFISDPAQSEPQQDKPSPEEMKAQAELQLQQAKLQGEQQLSEMRLTLQAQEAQQKMDLERQKAEFEAQQAESKMAFEMRMAEMKFDFDRRLAARRQVASEEQASLSQNRAGGDLDK